MTSIAERVQKLVALTASPNENEARNAAMAACKLIREHKLTIGGGSAPAPPPRATAPTAAPKPSAGNSYFDPEWFEQMMRDLGRVTARAANEHASRVKVNFDHGEKPTYGGPEPIYRGREKKTPPSTMNAPELRTIAEEGLECWQCGERIRVGERVWVSPLRKAMHVGCGW